MKEADEELAHNSSDGSISLSFKIDTVYACLFWKYLGIRLVIPGHGHLDGGEDIS